MSSSRSLSLVLASSAALSCLCAPIALAQSATITPGVKVVVRSDRTLFVTITWCDPNFSYDLGARTIVLNSTDITSQFTARWDNAACGSTDQQGDNFFYVDTATITLDAGPAAQTLTADDHFYGVGGVLHQLYAQASYYLPDPRRAVVVAADPQFRTVPPGTSGLSQRFAVTNTGNASDTVALTKSCTASASSCTLSASSLVIASGATQYATVTFSSSGTSGDTATIKVFATTAAPSESDSAWALVTVTPDASGGVVVVGTSPGINNFVARDLCVTIAIAENAAAECGDLRIVHALPGIQTLGQNRVPTLLYNSQHARPKPILQADVTLPSSWGTLPTTIRACVTIASVTRGCTSYAASDWGALGVTRRLSVLADTTNGADTTGLYGFTLQITTNRGDSALSATGELPIVNRQGSGLGAGWWLAGLEELHAVPSSRLMVVGGDGTVRVYASVATNTYTANNPTRPDTLTGSGSAFVRHAPNGVQIHFTSGQHDWTRSALGDTTKFSYTSGHLSSVQIPTRGGSTTYSFSGISGGVQTITDPGSRTVTIRSTSLTGGARVDSIEDPDGNRVRFYSSSGADQFRVDSLKNRRLKVTKFFWDAGVRLARAVRPLGITDSLLMAETRGLSTAQALDSVFTQLNGPRTDVADVTRFWVNGYGAPTRLRDALGRETRITYDGTWPGLAAEVINPVRLRTVAWYNSRGLPDSTKVYNPLGDGSNAKTSYLWHAVWNHVIQMTSATGLTSSDSLRSDYPLPAWEQYGSSSSRRVSYSYDSYRQLVAVTPPVVPAESLAYDTLGNVIRSRTSGAAISAYTRDALGRVTLAVSPYGDTSRTWYSVMDRVDSTLGKGNGMTATSGRTHAADTVRVANAYDADGDLTSVTRKVRVGGSLQSLTTSWTFDDADRVVAESRPGGGSFNYSLDMAGNRTS